MTYKTYIFDFDYTLADSSKGIVLCFRRILERHGHTGASDDDIRRTIGKSLEESFTLLCGVTDADTLRTYRKEYEREADTLMTVNTRLYPEVKEVLTALKAQGAQLAILSTKYRRRIGELVSQEFPAGFFDLIVGGEDVTHPKPHPEGLQKALTQLGAAPAETLYLGDSTVDAETAQAAGVDFAGVLHGVTTRDELAAYPHVAIYTDLRGLMPPQRVVSPERALPHTPAVQKRISLIQLLLLLYLGYMAMDELFLDDPYDSYLFTILFLLFLIRILCRRQVLPQAWHEALRRRLAPYLRRLRIVRVRIVRGTAIRPRSQESCHCLNCGETYIGNFCPRCGQNRRTSRYRFRNALSNIVGSFFNIDSGLSHTLIDLSYRPGHLIRHFIDGQRAPYFRPFQLLFLLAAFYIMSVRLVDPAALHETLSPNTQAKAETVMVLERLEKELDPEQNAVEHAIAKQALQLVKQDISRHPKDSLRIEKAEDEEEGEQLLANMRRIPQRLREYVRHHPFLDRVFSLLESWLHGNKAFLIMATLPLFAISTRLSFRHRRYRPRYNLTEHLFVQAYIACQLLLISIVLVFIHGHAAADDLYELSILGTFIVFWLDYLQLYRLPWRTALRRTIVMFIYSGLILFLVAILCVVTLTVMALIFK